MKDFVFKLRIVRVVWRELSHNILRCEGCQVSALRRTYKNLASELDEAIADYYGIPEATR